MHMILTYIVVILQMQLTKIIGQLLCGTDLPGIYIYILHIIPFIDNCLSYLHQVLGTNF